ncbi:hypothetical protein ACFP1Z_28880 [Streptomyces gamaensis]|uniref:Uncharacterized protein n=1 Tax=Streptomyces gamaensis TaxID=1763542 RepID=A0ABW0Z6Z9_9ACTN
MSRSRVVCKVLSVACNNPEDIQGTDEFYLTGGALAGGETGVLLTAPIAISAGDVKFFPKSEQVVFFDSIVDDSDILEIGMTAWDEDSKKDWTDRYADAVAKLGADVLSINVPVAAPVAPGLMKILANFVTDFWGFIDNDDLLGVFRSSETVGNLKPGNKKWSFSDQIPLDPVIKQFYKKTVKTGINSLLPGYSEWNYEVTWNMDIARGV